MGKVFHKKNGDRFIHQVVNKAVIGVFLMNLVILLATAALILSAKSSNHFELRLSLYRFIAGIIPCILSKLLLRYQK